MVVKACLALLALVATACSAPRAAPTTPAAPAANVTNGSPGSTARLHVLMINGGGTREQNFASHLSHVRQLVELLTKAGVPRDRISILASDGPAPAADLATRETEPEGFWMVARTRLGAALEVPVTFTNSTVPGHPLAPATRPTLDRWFAAARARIAPGDTLLLYVTDHGTDDKKDPLENRIVLWGRNETITVRQLRAQLDRLHPDVRVVSLMSQCFSGGFAGLMYPRAGGTPRGNVCGYFASTADRPAYGCYPENLGREGIGHSFEFFAALARSGRFADAHAEVLVSDRTPDVPLRTSDVFLQDTVARAARAARTDESKVVDGLLREAFKNRGQWERELRLLDAIGRAFGTFSPRSLGELEAHGKVVPQLLDQLEAQGKHWDASLADTTEAHLLRFLSERADWSRRIGRVSPQAMTPDARRALTVDLLRELRAHAARDADARTRLDTLAQKNELADKAIYRMDVRLAALLRMRTVLTSIAGQAHLAARGTPDERRAFQALRACEELTIPVDPAAPAARVIEPFPPFAEEQRLAAEVLPAWMGIGFGNVPRSVRARHGLSPGAAFVSQVYEGSPAQAAGLQPGDVVLGPPGKPFTAEKEIRSFTALLPIGKPQPIEVLRGDARRTLTLIPGRFPNEAPALPAPPKVSDRARPVVGAAYRGQPPAALATGPHVLFFWATWCGPCKASIPELLEFSRARKVPIIAITDEPREELDQFFAGFKLPFPENVVSDEARASFIGYGVSGTPTFVLVDGGKIAAYATGYLPGRGLPLPGWRR